MYTVLIALLASPASASSLAALVAATAQESADDTLPAVALSGDGSTLVDVGRLPVDGEPALAEAVDDTELVRIAGLELQPGPVDVAFVGHQPIAPGRSFWLEHGGLVWTIAASADAPWVLELGDHPHRMAPMFTWASAPVDDGEPVLLWAGDLDQDGRLDLMVDVSADPERSAPTLFLSTEADGEAHVGAAARMVVRRASADVGGDTLPSADPVDRVEPFQQVSAIYDR